jgi:hypothetical protein
MAVARSEQNSPGFGDEVPEINVNFTLGGGVFGSEANPAARLTLHGASTDDEEIGWRAARSHFVLHR